jgi:hypothetical protein
MPSAETFTPHLSGHFPLRPRTPNLSTSRCYSVEGMPGNFLDKGTVVEAMDLFEFPRLGSYLVCQVMRHGLFLGSISLAAKKIFANIGAVGKEDQQHQQAVDT